MPKMIALLRGVNVSGQRPVPMAGLRECIKPALFSNVRTYLQSGNLVFESTAASTSTLKDELERCIKRRFGFPVLVVLRTAQELAAVSKRNPFLKQSSIDKQKLYVTFLSEAPAQRARANLDRFKGGPEHFELIGKEIYLYYPLGFGRAKLSNNMFERLLSVDATTRNWNTVTRLDVMAKS